MTENTEINNQRRKETDIYRKTRTFYRTVVKTRTDIYRKARTFFNGQYRQLRRNADNYGQAMKIRMQLAITCVCFHAAGRRELKYLFNFEI